MDFQNVYEDEDRAEAYAGLDFPGTYFLAFRDIPDLISRHVTGKQALDFGCGAGRSTRFLKRLGFETVGVDISSDMLAKARELDPAGDYRLGLGSVTGEVDVVLSAFTFDNIPTREAKLDGLARLKALLAVGGRIVNLVSSPDIYTHEWASFSTKDFPENRTARAGDRVRTIMLDVPDRRPVDDVLWPDGAYRELYAEAGLEVVEVHKPLARDDEPYEWVNETTIAPWVIYVLAPQR